MSEQYRVFPRIAQFKEATSLRQRLTELGIELPLDDCVLTADKGSPLAQPFKVGSVTVANRWCIQPMEGWDANCDGSPSEHTFRRWGNFGRSGAKLIWGGEAAAVRPDGRANPRQIIAIHRNRAGLRALLDTLYREHEYRLGTVEGLLVGLQLTHSGRFCKPNDDKRLEPRIAYHHPLLDEKFGIDSRDNSLVWTDDELERLIDAYVVAARLAQDVGFDFVDVKSCHGYLLHEFLSARRRPGKFGGDFDGRTRLLRDIVTFIQEECPGLMIGVRLSVFDSVPFQTSHESGRPMPFDSCLPYDCGFGVDADDPLSPDLSESLRLVEMLESYGVVAVNISCGSPYYNPHIQRPAYFPPSDGYQPPEDPLVGVSRQINAARVFKQRFPDLPLIGSGYSYLQDYLPHVAQAVVRGGWIDFVGLGRMVLSYPDLPVDTLTIGKMQRKKVCRTFSDCTTAPRNGIISGCFPLDSYYKNLAEADVLRKRKRELVQQPRLYYSDSSESVTASAGGEEKD